MADKAMEPLMADKAMEPDERTKREIAAGKKAVASIDTAKMSATVRAEMAAGRAAVKVHSVASQVAQDASDANKVLADQAATEELPGDPLPPDPVPEPVHEEPHEEPTPDDPAAGEDFVDPAPDADPGADTALED